MDFRETESTDDSTVSGIILSEPGVNVQARVEAAINEVVSELREGEAGEALRKVQRPVMPLPNIGTTLTSEFTSPNIFTMAFPCLFPYEKGDFHVNRPVTCPTLHDWAEHLLWYQRWKFCEA